MKDFFRKWGLAINVLGFAVFILLIKIAFHAFEFEPIANNPLLSAVIGGMTFLIGFILAGTMTDFKESEKLPGDIVSSLESIYEDGTHLKKLNKKFDMDNLNKVLDEIVDNLKKDLKVDKKRMAIHSISKLTESVIEAEKLGLPAVWIARIKTEQATLKKIIFRMYNIKDTSFIPAAYAIVDILVFITLGILVLLKFDRFYEGLLMTGIVGYIFIYMTMLIKDIDDPFGEKSYADINLYLLSSFRNRETHQ
jgi:hypothetical protein